jgi:hypothetical protein
MFLNPGITILILFEKFFKPPRCLAKNVTEKRPPTSVKTGANGGGNLRRKLAADKQEGVAS